MPKYVLKEDVDKGLVDPTKPLEEQPQYKKKIEEEHQQKEKQFEQKAQRQRPKKERPPRKERPKFNWNKDEITVDSKAPERPKKLLEKPDQKKHRQGFQKLKAEREALKAERNAILDEQRMIIRDINESKKYGREVNTQYSGVMREKMAQENQIRKEIKALDDHKKKIHGEIDFLKAKVEELRRPNNSEGLSAELLQKRISQKEHLLTTSQIGKKEQAKLNTQINGLKRALPKARNSIQIESDINKINDQIQILYKEVKPIKQQLHVKITQVNDIKAQIEELKTQLNNEKGAVQEHKSIEEIKAEYDVKLRAVEQKRDKLEDTIDDYMDAHTRAIDEYEDQQDLLRYIDWFEKEVEWKKKRKEEEARKEKERQEREKKKQKEKEQYQKRQEERKKREEERKKREQQYKARLEKQKEDFINRNPNHQTIDLCHSLIDYCQNLRPVATFKYEDPKSKAPGQIKFGKEWQKELKSGAEIIVSKKQKDEEKKPQPAPKKKEQKPEEKNFEHGIEVINQFQAIKLLPPNNPAEIDSTIKLINDKIDFYSNPTEEEKSAFREKSIQEWEERQKGRESRKPGNYREKEEGKEGNYKEKAEGQEEPRREKKEQNRRGKKAELKKDDFPELA